MKLMSGTAPEIAGIVIFQRQPAVFSAGGKDFWRANPAILNEQAQNR
jgi:hypothetical protein